MHAAEHIFAVPDITLHKSHMVLAGNIVHIAIDLKVSVLGRHVRAGLLHHMFFMDTAVILQFLDRDKFQSVLLRQLPQIRGPHHGSVFLHDLTAHAALGKSRQTHEVHSCLGMAVSHEHSAPSCYKREYVSRSSEILGLCRRVHAFHHRVRALRRGNSCCRVHMVNGDRECRTVVIRVLGYHLRKSQPLCHCRAHRRTDQSLCVACHEIDICLCRELCRADHISLILPVRVICHENDFSRPQIFDRFFDCVVLLVHIFLPFQSPLLKVFLSAGFLLLKL